MNKQELFELIDEFESKFFNQPSKVLQHFKSWVDIKEGEGSISLNDNELLNLIIKKGVAVGFIALLVKESAGGFKEYNDFIGDKNLYLTEFEFNAIANKIQELC